MQNLFDVSGKTIVITGSTRGIGFTLAQNLKELGANVWIHGSNKERTQKVAEKYGFKFVWADLSDLSTIDLMVDTIIKEEEKIDVLINNAGFEVHDKLEELDAKKITDIHNINLNSPMMIAKKLFPLLKKSDYPSIINISSIHQYVPVKTNIYYCTAKAALEMFNKVASLEWAKYNIRVNNIAPGAIATDMNRELLKELPFEDWIPLQRVGDASEIVGPVVFLCSKASSYMTGASLFVDGGYQHNLLRY